MSEPTAKPRFPCNSPFFFIAVGITILAACLDIYFYHHAGGLWRDEVNSINIGLGSLQNITHDSFPVLFPFCVRWLGWAGLQDWRLLGLLVSWLMLAALWLSARWVRQVPPIWTLILVGLNAWGIIYFESVRPYGLGSVFIVVCFGAAWRYWQVPDIGNWLVFTAVCVASVQTLYHNAALVGAICLAGMWLGMKTKNYRKIIWFLFAGAFSAISLLPYFQCISNITTSTTFKRDFFDFPSAMTSLETLLAFPMPQYLWVWTGLALVAISLGLRTKNFREPTVQSFAALTFILATVLYFCFLRTANYYVQTWYFLPLFALAGICLETCLPRPEGKWRAGIIGGLLATALISALFSLHILDWRMTNVDQLAQRIACESNPRDFVLVNDWTYGQTFDHYFTATNPWSTVPPIADVKTSRYDLFQEATKKTNVMEPLLTDLEKTLRTGHRIWIVGNFTGWNQSYAAVPHITVIWEFNQRLNDFLRAHSQQIQCLDAGTNENINYNERAALYQCGGWRD
jgi:hypothetical protein